METYSVADRATKRLSSRLFVGEPQLAKYSAPPLIAPGLSSRGASLTHCNLYNVRVEVNADQSN